MPRPDGGQVETDSRKIWRTFCENWKLYRGTPSRYWLEHELVEVFGVDLVPSAETADALYDQIASCVADPQFRPRALLDRFNIEVISTTDSATSELQHHAKLAADGLGARVLPTFRPDALAYLDRSTWRADVAELARVSGIDTMSYGGYLEALRQRWAVFVEAGARATDHGHLLADTTPMEAGAAAELYARVLGGKEPDRGREDRLDQGEERLRRPRDPGDGRAGRAPAAAQPAASAAESGACGRRPVWERARLPPRAPGPAVASLLCAPLFFDDEFLGLLKIAAWKRRPFDRVGPGRGRALPARRRGVDPQRPGQHVARAPGDAGRDQATLVTLARAVAHDVNNAIGAILPLAQQMREDLREGDRPPGGAGRDLER